jgi:hypothetical protein
MSATEATSRFPAVEADDSDAVIDVPEPLASVPLWTNAIAGNASAS